MLVGLGFGLTSGVAPTEPTGWEPWLAWAIDGWSGNFAFASLITLLIVFPDGLADRSRTGRNVGRWTIATLFGVVLVALAADPVGGGDTSGFPTYPNPLGLHLVSNSLVAGGFTVLILVGVASVGWLWRRHGRAAGETRRRYSLVLYAFSVLFVSMLGGMGLSGALGDVAWAPAYASWLLLPTAISVAVVRRGLYGVDRIISRTLSYGLVAVVISAAFGVPVILLPVLLGGSSALVVAASTLVAATLFNPARRRIQALVDRRFDRSKFDADLAARSFGAMLRTSTDLDHTLTELADVIARTVAPASTTVWIRGQA